MISARRGLFGGLLVLATLLTWPLGTLANPPDGNGDHNHGGGGGGGGDNTPPAAITDLSEVAVTHNSLTFTWTATGDDGFEGVAESYDLRYALFPIDLNNWNDATQASGEPTPAAPGTLEQYTLGDLPPETTFYIGLRVLDDRDNVSDLSNVVLTSTAALPFTPWSTSIVDAQDDPGKWSSVAFDPSSGLPAVAYHFTNHRNGNHHIDALNFASFNGSFWEIDEMITPAIGWIDLEFDPNTGLPFIAFKCGAEVHVAWNDGAEWLTEMVDQSGSGSRVSLEFDPVGRPTLAYAAPTANGATIRFARLVNGSWMTEDVGTVGPNDIEHRFDPDTGHPAIAFRFPVTVAGFAFFDGSEWTIEIIDAADVASVSEFHLEFNPVSGNAMVAYEEFPSLFPVVPTRIRLFERTGDGSWMSHDVFEDPENFDSLYDFAVDSAGVPLILHGVLGELIFSWWDDSSGTWVDELVFPGGALLGREISLDIGPNGELAATFQRDGGNDGPDVDNELIIGIR